MNSADKEVRPSHYGGDYTNDKDEWNTAAFEKRLPDSPEWKNNEKGSKSSKKSSRLQDITVGGGNSDHHHEDTNHSKQWPYEKEKIPCRVYGPKNTRPGAAADAINKEYFDPNFADRAKNTTFNNNDNDFADHGDDDYDNRQFELQPNYSEQDDKDDDSFAGDDDDTDEPITVNPQKSKSNRTKENDRTANAMNVEDYGGSNRSSSTTNNADPPPRVQRRMSSGGLAPSECGGRNGAVASRRGSLTGAKTYKRGQSCRQLSGHRDDDLTAVEQNKNDVRGYYRAAAAERQSQRKQAEQEAADPQILRADVDERIRPTRARSNRDKSGSLDSATSHGERVVTTGSARNLGGARQAPTSRRGGTGRHKSSDDPSVMMPGQHASTTRSSRGSTSSRNDELGAATLHGTSGKSAVSRIRRSTSDEVSSKKTNSSSSNQRPSSSEERIDRRAKFKRAMSTENVRRPEEYGPDGGQGQTEEPKRRGGRRSIVAAESNKSNTVTRKGRSLQVEEKEDSSSEAPSDSEVDSDDDSFADDTETVLYEKGMKSSTKRSSKDRQPGKNRSASQQHKKDGEARDLLELLHENKPVKIRDMQDKDNRRILHFLLYEHRMGVSLQEMKKSIRQEISEDPEEALRRVPLPLFVEPQT